MASLEQLTVGIPGAGRRTLLAALPGDLRLPETLRLCVLDAVRMDAPAQIALLDSLAAEPDAEPLFVLNKADLIGGPRTAVTRTLALLRERGFSRPELYLTCAEAARLFRLPADAQPLDEEQSRAVGDFYFRYGPGENNLSAFAVTDAKRWRLGSREVTPEQLCLALTNTGVTALETRLRALAETPPEEGPVPAASPETAEPAAEDGAPAILPEPIEPAAEDGAPAASPEPIEPAAEDGAPAILPEPIEPAAEDGTPAILPEPIEPAAEDGTPAAQPEPAGPAAEDDEPAARPEPAEPAAEDGAPAAPPEPETSGPDALPADAEPSDGDALDEVETALKKLFQEEAAEAVPGAAPEPAPAGGSALGLRERAETADCAELLKLAAEVQAENIPSEDKERLLDALHKTYKERELSELRALTLDADTRELPELLALRDRINTGPYTVQTRTPYAELLTRRIDELHTAALANLCAGAEEADENQLAALRAAVDAVDCAEVLKTDCYARLDARQDVLDREALDRVTAGAEYMSEEELRAVAVTLEAKNWSPKYVTAYRQRIEILREAAVVRALRGELADLDDMERREVLALREHIQSQALPSRFTAAPLAQIDERLYQMDMLRLLALNNDFDRLGFEELDNLRASAARAEVCERARTAYLNRLREREEALILENTDARAQLTRQLIGQYKMRMSDFTLAGASQDYAERVQAFWGGSGLEQPRDVPVFLFDNASDYAFTGSRFYYKTGRDLAFLPLEEISRFQIMRQRLAMNLQIVRRDNTYLLTEARIGRAGAERTLDFLNECLRRWFEPGLDGARPVNPIRTRRFELSEFTQPTQALLPDAETALNVFRSSYAAARLREGNLIRAGEEGWEQRARRLLLNFELPESTPLIWFCSASLFGSVREGVALGPKAIYQKEGKQPTRVLPLGEIWQVSRTGGRQVTVTTLQNQSWKLDIAGDMAPLIADYVRTIQLGNYLRSAGGPA